MKQLFLAIGILMTATMFGQKEVVSAYNANKDGDFRAAATYIEQAILVEKAALKEKTWRYRGEIYLNIAADTSVYAEYPNALVLAKDSYLKAKELDKKGRYENEILTGLSRVQVQSSNNGINYYNQGAFDIAGNSFDLAAEIARKFEMVDTMAVYNAALSYEKAHQELLESARPKLTSDKISDDLKKKLQNIGLKTESDITIKLIKAIINSEEEKAALSPTDMMINLSEEDKAAISTDMISNLLQKAEKMNDLAIERYYECSEIGYQVPNVFLFISTLYRNSGDNDSALSTLQKARESYPREQSLIIEELNIYLTSGDFEKAKSNLQLAAEQDPTNEILWFSLGSVFDNLENADEAISAYKKAIEVKADYFDANYNLGALYFNQAVQGINTANDMWKPRMTSREAAAQKKLENKAKELFSTAKPYLEIAHEVNPEDVQTIRSLKDIYARTGEDDNFLKMNDILKKLQN